MRPRTTSCSVGIGRPGTISSAAILASASLVPRDRGVDQGDDVPGGEPVGGGVEQRRRHGGGRTEPGPHGAGQRPGGAEGVRDEARTGEPVVTRRRQARAAPEQPGDPTLPESCAQVAARATVSAHDAGEEGTDAVGQPPGVVRVCPVPTCPVAVCPVPTFAVPTCPVAGSRVPAGPVVGSGRRSQNRHGGQGGCPDAADPGRAPRAGDDEREAGQHDPAVTHRHDVPGRDAPGDPATRDAEPQRGRQLNGIRGDDGEHTTGDVEVERGSVHAQHRRRHRRTPEERGRQHRHGARQHRARRGDGRHTATLARRLQ